MEKRPKGQNFSMMISGPIWVCVKSNNSNSLFDQRNLKNGSAVKMSHMEEMPAWQMRGEYKSVRDEKQWLSFFCTAQPRHTWFGLGQAVTAHKEYPNFEHFQKLQKNISGRFNEITQCSSRECRLTSNRQLLLLLLWFLLPRNRSLPRRLTGCFACPFISAGIYSVSNIAKSGS